MRRLFGNTVPASLGGAILALAGMPALAQGNPAGSAIAAKGTAAGAAACIACHGAKGEGNAAAGFPRLAGLPAAYLAAQLDQFAAARRQSPVMGPIAKQLTGPERKAVADYYGALPAAPALGGGDKAALRQADTGRWLALRGRWDANLPACVQCHGPGGGGIGAAFPALAGQSSAYLAAQLHAFKSGARAGGPQDLMKVVASKLSDGDITAVANYFGGGKP
jgi:cytochrome c553